MSVLIKGMKIPPSCDECCFKVFNEDRDRYFCPFTGIWTLSTSRQDDCPLIEVPIDYDELLKVAKAMHTWIFLNSVDEQEAYDECGLTDEMNAVLGYAGSFTVIPADKEEAKE